eukprot:TRINITY_DN59674_c0_g1_i1.p1 TRINITY_DN59674_c0_g1~~TRINITY_DN59674_c0_g1_i1.p1  ORF type:complete len:290 (+),score=135.04 TRINITY_DN59674_c0_g1_i1:182-1051(+)
MHNHPTVNYVPKDKKYKLLVGVLSARHHFQRRQLIRETYKKYEASYPNVLIRFVVGDKHCALAPNQRRTSWDCTLKTGGDAAAPTGVDAVKFVVKERLIDEELHAEQEKYKDLVLVDHIDVYRTLAHKLAKWYEWAYENLDFDFALKVDDDTWVHVPNLMKDIVTVSTKMTWWSHFRTDWEVHRGTTGKWSEPDYTSKRYPSFGCGGGNILSRDLVGVIGNATDQLMYYQGEDVSVGIWLAGVKVNFQENMNFHRPKCDNAEFTQPQMDPADFRTYYNNYEKCKRICGC